MNAKILFRLIAGLAFLWTITEAMAESPATPDEAVKIGWSRLHGKPFTLGWVDSSGAVADQTFITLSATKPSRQAKDFAKRISEGDAKEVVFVVAGPNSAKAKCVVAGALKLQKKKLPKLTLCFIGDPEHEAEVALLVAAVGGQVPPSSSEKKNSFRFEVRQK